MSTLPTPHPPRERPRTPRPQAPAAAHLGSIRMARRAGSLAPGDKIGWAYLVRDPTADRAAAACGWQIVRYAGTTTAGHIAVAEGTRHVYRYVPGTLTVLPLMLESAAPRYPLASSHYVRACDQVEAALDSAGHADYYARVAQAVQTRIAQAGAYGIVRTADDYARAIRASWRAPQLLRPPEPTVEHAVLTALALALPFADAVQLAIIGARGHYLWPQSAIEAALTAAIHRLQSKSPALFARGYLSNWPAGHITAALTD